MKITADGGDDAAASPAARWWTLAAVCLGTFMLLLDFSIVYVALPDIQQSLGASLASLQWIVDSYALSLAALLLTAGSLATIRGKDFAAQQSQPAQQANGASHPRQPAAAAPATSR